MAARWFLLPGGVEILEHDGRDGSAHRSRYTLSWDGAAWRVAAIVDLDAAG